MKGISGSTPLIHRKTEKIKIESVNTNTIIPNSAKGKMRKIKLIMIKPMSRSNAWQALYLTK